MVWKTGKWEATLPRWLPQRPHPSNTGRFMRWQSEREGERERPSYKVCCCRLNLQTKAELGHISGRLSENRARAEFPDCSDTLASDNKSFVRWSHSVKSAIRSTQRDFISPSPPCPTSTLALALPVTPCSHSEQCQCVCVHRDLN